MIDNVFLLGAGFSKSMGLPLLGDFIDRSKDIFYTPEFKDNDFYSHFSNVFDFRKEIAVVTDKFQFDLDNIETLLGYLEMYEMTNLSPKAKKNDVAQLIRHTLVKSKNQTKNINVVFSEVLEVLKPFVPVEDAFARVYDNGVSKRFSTGELLSGLALGMLTSKPIKNSIITFNYDDIIEDGLTFWNASASYGFNFVNDERSKKFKKSIGYYKLHGSINWIMKDGQKEIPTLIDGTKYGSDSGDILLTPPTWNKGGFVGPMQTVWTNATQAIMSCKNLIIIGYSLPSSDEYIKYALGTALGNNHRLKSVIVVDPSKETQARFKQIFNDNTQRRRLRMYENTVEAFLSDIGYLSSLGLIENINRIEKY